ncbi:MAG: hypothetical protein NZ570_07205 [Candidatus Caldarchaeum sp.]|nr:hypothetical protein [Candidatus Caldarchaeum sp.]MDW7978368.1 hypothetical protein [Candidatus Caldarchaeum sp.]MDW8360032.1 hypothetical protein [Candidatus Caldarchaeum sp.]
MDVRQLALLLAGLVLVVVGLAVSWRLIVELIGLVLVVLGLFLAASALMRRR